jgi:biopolymer transport protein ExbD
MKRRRLRKEAAHLEITAFINLVVVLVPFLLSTAVFTRLAVIDLSLPAKTSGVMELKENNLQLEVVIRKDALEVGDRIGGLIQRLPVNAAGQHDLANLAALMVQLKAKFPDKREATVLAEPNTAYDTIVQVMDAMRSANTAQGQKVVKAELFPAISLGDAPVRGAK